MEASETNPVVWSAVSCPFRRAGVYYGISEARTHGGAARLLLPRRGQVYTGGAAVVRDGEDPVPLAYFAVRDPSAVRVIPVPAAKAGGRAAKGPDGSEHVRLVFDPAAFRAPRDRDAGETLAVLDLLRRSADHATEAVFIVTIGLRTDLERRFFDDVIRAVPRGVYAEICERITSVKDSFCG